MKSDGTNIVKINSSVIGECVAKLNGFHEEPYRSQYDNAASQSSPREVPRYHFVISAPSRSSDATSSGCRFQNHVSSQMHQVAPPWFGAQKNHFPEQCHVTSPEFIRESFSPLCLQTAPADDFQPSFVGDDLFLPYSVSVVSCEHTENTSMPSAMFTVDESCSGVCQQHKSN